MESQPYLDTRLSTLILNSNKVRMVCRHTHFIVDNLIYLARQLKHFPDVNRWYEHTCYMQWFNTYKTKQTCPMHFMCSKQLSYLCHKLCGSFATSQGNYYKITNPGKRKFNPESVCLWLLFVVAQYPILAFQSEKNHYWLRCHTKWKCSILIINHQPKYRQMTLILFLTLVSQNPILHRTHPINSSLIYQLWFFTKCCPLHLFWCVWGGMVHTGDLQ